MVHQRLVPQVFPANSAVPVDEERAVELLAGRGHIGAVARRHSTVRVGKKRERSFMTGRDIGPVDGRSIGTDRQDLCAQPADGRGVLFEQRKLVSAERTDHAQVEDQNQMRPVAVVRQPDHAVMLIDEGKVGG